MALKHHTGLEPPCFSTFVYKKSSFRLGLWKMELWSHCVRTEPVNLGLWDPYGVRGCVFLYFKNPLP